MEELDRLVLLERLKELGRVSVERMVALDAFPTGMKLEIAKWLVEQDKDKNWVIEQEILAGLANFKRDRLRAGSAANPLADELQLQAQDAPQFVLAKRAENDDLIEPVYELGREIVPCGVDTRVRDPLRSGFIERRLDRRESQLRPDQRFDFPGTQVACHEDQGAGEIHLPVIA